MRKLSVLWVATCAVFFCAEMSFGQQTTLTAGLDDAGGLPISTGDKVDGVQTATVTLAPDVDPGQLLMAVVVRLDSQIVGCLDDDGDECDGGENFTGVDEFGDPIFGCANDTDDDGDTFVDSDDDDCVGTQGWSMSIVTDPCFGVARGTTNGTAGDLDINGGLRDVNGGNFEKTEVVNPANPANGGQEGVVSAVVLSFTNPIFLPQVGEETVLIINGRMSPGALAAGAMTDPCGISVLPAEDNGLAGSGEPVKTAVTVGGETDTPAICNLLIKFMGEGEVVEEICDNEIDDDGDTLVDCDNDDCDADPACEVVTPEICDNEIDDDEDGDVDCDDADCAADPACEVVTPEVCDNGVDDDEDGAVDCDDSDCAADPACEVPPEEGETALSLALQGASDSSKTGSLATDTIVGPVPAASPQAVIVEVRLTSAIEGCLDDDGDDCDGGENFSGVDEFGDPIFGCADEIDNDGDTLVDAEDDDCRGVQGWSMSVAVEPCYGLARATTNGTRGDLDLNPPGLRDVGGGNFEKTEVVNPDNPANGGQEGAVSAVVLSFTNPIFLPQTTEEPVLILNGRIDVSALANPGDMTDPCLLRILPPAEDGLAGSGEPVKTAVTVGGETSNPVICDLQVKIAVESGPEPENEFVRGDPNDDGRINIADGVWIINELFQEGPETACQDAADGNDDGMVDASDALYLISYQFTSGPVPPAPFGACGEDPTADEVTCETAASACP